ncbi:hypothetical protein [Arhodomonas sp. AD133]|uniref:hypothetical protein n=1 Tax=Arhodomonas sp. AD133 TaxID=3415009 RepID=UPI003EBA487B
MTGLDRISYEKWQALIRLPFLSLLAVYLDQRGRMHARQVQVYCDHLGAIVARDPGSTLAQIADDALRESVNQFKELRPDDVDHFIARCAIAVEAARTALDPASFDELCRLTKELASAIRTSAPWHLRLRMIRFRHRQSAVPFGQQLLRALAV